MADRQSKPRKYVFESPLVRLAADFGYSDVYEDGYDIVDPEWQTTADGKPTGNALTLEMEPPANATSPWKVKYSWQGTGMVSAQTVLDVQPLNDSRVEVSIPLNSFTVDGKGNTKLAFPGIEGKLRFVISAGNAS